MAIFNNNQKYNASIIIDLLLNDYGYLKLNNGMFCNAIRLAIGKDPIKYSSEYPKSEELNEIIDDPIVANDVY